MTIKINRPHAHLSRESPFRPRPRSPSRRVLSLLDDWSTHQLNRPVHTFPLHVFEQVRIPGRRGRLRVSEGLSNCAEIGARGQHKARSRSPQIVSAEALKAGVLPNGSPWAVQITARL